MQVYSTVLENNYSTQFFSSISSIDSNLWDSIYDKIPFYKKHNFLSVIEQTHQDIDFRYGTRQLVLKNINMRFKTGEKIALVGESGSGKTTIAKLLMNFYVVEKGELVINSYNITEIYAIKAN